MKRIFSLTLFVSIIASHFSGCSNSPSNSDGSTQKDSSNTDGTTDRSTNGKTLTFATESLDGKQAGRHASIAHHENTIGIVYYREASDQTVTCIGASGSSNQPSTEVWYTQFGGSSWSTPVLVDRTIGPSTQGLAITFTPDGRVHLGYLGGDTSELACDSSDAMIASSSDGNTFSGTSTPYATNGDYGDTVGWWMTLAADASGTVHAAYRDVLFGTFESIGETQADLRLGPGSGEVVVDKKGSGVYPILLFTQDNKPVIAHYNPNRSGLEGGIQLSRRSAPIGTSGTWTSKQIVAGSTKERFGFATDGKGNFAIAYYEANLGALHYKESKGGLDNWGDAVLVDTGTKENGTFASLAFDSNGNPGISYYRCGGSKGSSCNPEPGQDGLMFAYRSNGAWKVQEVDDGKEFDCGTYTSLTFTPDNRPIIAYQCIRFNSQSQDWVTALKVANGVWQ